LVIDHYKSDSGSKQTANDDTQRSWNTWADSRSQNGTHTGAVQNGRTACQNGGGQLT
jgi:hypothetical protein